MIDPEDGKTDSVYINGKHEWMNSFEKARREVLIKMLEFNLDTFIDCLKGTYYFSENPPDYFYNVLDALGALRNDEEFSIFSSKVIKTLHLNYELMVKYDFSIRQQKKIIGLSDHDFNFSLNIFVLYYLNEYKGNITFLDLIARNTSKDVKSYLDAMSMTEIEWSNYFMDRSELVYNNFSLENDVLDYDFYNEKYDVDLDSLLKIKRAEDQYIAPLLIYDDNIEDYKLEDKEDDLDYGHAIINKKLLNIENLKLSNVNDDSLSDEYIYTQIENHLASKGALFNISFLIKFYMIIIKHYFKENKTDSLKKATKDLLKLSNSFQLSQRNMYDISLLFIDINRFNIALDFTKKITDSDLKDKVVDLCCSEYSTKEIIKKAYSLDKISSRKFIERLIVSNRVFSEDEYFMLCNNSAGYIMELNHLLSSQDSKVNL